MSDDGIPEDIVDNLFQRLTVAILAELGKYGAAVAGENADLRKRIAASHTACVNAAIASVLDEFRREWRGLN